MINGAHAIIYSTKPDADRAVLRDVGWPALTVPMGFTLDSMPAGLEFLGRAFSEPRLFGFAYAYEQATKHRRPPTTTPALGR